MRKLLFILLLVLVVSCDKPDDASLQINKSSQMSLELASLLISSTKDSITESEAINIAKLSTLLRNTNTKSAELREVENVIEISNDAGETAMYAVNYKNKQGYTLISATKNFYPILAEVATGQFNDDIYKTGVSVLVDGYIAGISHVKTLPADSVAKFRTMWKIYEKQVVPNVATTKLNEFDTFLTNQLHEWAETSHDFYPLSEAQSMLPESVYLSFCAAAEGMSNPEYDYMTYAFVVETIDRYEYNPNNYLITTQWDQLEPYNHSCEYLGYGRYDTLGCGAVAMGQIMKYYQWPTLSWSWNDMPDKLNGSTDGETPLSQFLYSIALKIQEEGEPLNSSNTYNVYRSLCNDYGYSCSIINHSQSRVITSIQNSRPVFMRGRMPNETYGHAWICDGYGLEQQRVVYTLYVIAASNTLEYVTACDPYCDEVLSLGYYFHMNWGWGGTDDGWFIDGPYTTSVNGYTVDRKDIVDIRKNN